MININLNAKLIWAIVLWNCSQRSISMPLENIQKSYGINTTMRANELETTPFLRTYCSTHLYARLNRNIFDCLEQENFLKSFLIYFRLKTNDKWIVESNPITQKKKTHKNTMTTPSQVKRNKTHIIKKNVQVKMSMSNLDKGTNI